MEYVYTNKRDCLSRLRELLNLPIDLGRWNDDLLEGLCQACETAPTESVNAFAMKLGRWVIKKDDLNIFGIVRDTVVTLASAHFIVGNLPTSGVAGLTFGLVELFRKVKSKGVVLSEDQAVVFAAVAAARKKIAISEILTAVQMRPDGKLWDDQRVRLQLLELEEMYTHDGRVKLVESYSDGFWGTAGT